MKSVFIKDNPQNFTYEQCKVVIEWISKDTKLVSLEQTKRNLENQLNSVNNRLLELYQIENRIEE